eukprot:SAG31_NODE_1557_length_7884_cov_69.027357_2_plen_43_part_00
MAVPCGMPLSMYDDHRAPADLADHVYTSIIEFLPVLNLVPDS